MPTLYNQKKDEFPCDAVYIGRPSKWGNPFAIGKHGNRIEVLVKYRSYLERNPKLVADAKVELKGKDLVCHCAPLRCHGEILMEIANEAVHT